MTLPLLKTVAYEGIVTLPSNRLYFVASYWEVARCALLCAIQMEVVVCKKIWLKWLQ